MGDGQAEGKARDTSPPRAQAEEHPLLFPCPALTLLCPHRLVHSPLGRGHAQGEGVDSTPVGAGPQRGAVAGACQETKLYI